MPETGYVRCARGSPRRLLRWLMLALICLGLALLLWLVVLSRVAVSVAYPMLSLNYVLGAAGGAFYLA